MVNCPRKYKNLGEGSFGEQKMVTAEMLRQFCMNDSYLYHQIMELWKEGNVSSRKRFQILPFDEKNSFSTVQTSDGRIAFDNSDNKTVRINFDDILNLDEFVDKNRSTTTIDSRKTGDGITRQCTIPKVKTGTLYKTTMTNGPWGGLSCNEYWYVGYDKTRHYETRPNWLENPLNPEIPSIVRAQTFKPKNSGLLEGVTLNLQGGNNTGSPLIVQIRRTRKVNGFLTPVPTNEKHLAHAEVRFNEINPGRFTIEFDNPPYLNKNDTYAIVVMSPLSHFDNCYGLGGWSATCHGDLYTDGHAFLSENNGNTWMIYGKKDDVPYHKGMKKPQDFAFQCHILEEKTEYKPNTDYWLYLKPIFSNPVSSIQLANVDDGDNSNDYSITYYVSNNGHDWIELGDSLSAEFNDHRQITFVKAKLRTSNKNNAPYIKSINVILTTDKPKLGYARTAFYTPKVSSMLGANLWGSINAPSAADYGCSCNVEVVRNTVCTEHYSIIKPGLVEFYLPAIEHNVSSEQYNKVLSNIKGKTDLEAYNYLKEEMSIVNALKEADIYILGCEDDDNIMLPPLFTGIKVKNSPAYPTLSCTLAINATNEPDISLGEWYDYSFDYDNDEIIFFKDVLDDLQSGVLIFEYNPVFVQDLTNDDMAFRLDYSTEEFNLTSEDIQNRFLELKMAPHDPIRKVILNPEQEDSQEFFEDKDYTVDYNNKKIIFNDGVVLKETDIITVIYTPDLEDISLSIGYWFKREDTISNVYAEHSYIEYKT